MKLPPDISGVELIAVPDARIAGSRFGATVQTTRRELRSHGTEAVVSLLPPCIVGVVIGQFAAGSRSSKKSQEGLPCEASFGESNFAPPPIKIA